MVGGGKILSVLDPYPVAFDSRLGEWACGWDSSSRWISGPADVAGSVLCALVIEGCGACWGHSDIAAVDESNWCTSFDNTDRLLDQLVASDEVSWSR